MIRINYITNLDVNNYSGGWSGMNHHVYGQLTRCFDVNLIQNVNPPYFLSERVVSKVFRVAGMKGIFPAFTRGRLNKIKEEVERKIDTNGQLNFYHGSTPWLHIENKSPYSAYLDCCFSSYIRIYHKQEHFNARQLKELFNKETEFLDNANSIFFSSRWALDDTKNNYNLTGKNFFVAGLGSGLEFDNVSNNRSKPYFLFVGMDFYGKGGNVVAEAFEIVNKEYPEFKLKIAGQEPPQKYMAFVEYEGVLNKSDKTQLNKLKTLFAEAYCFVLPTTKDMTPLVLVEAQAAGCPVIATNSFGIPEIVRNDETGILLNASLPLKEQLVSAMQRMITHKEMYAKFVRNSPAHISNNFTWERTGKIIREKIFESSSA